MGVLPLEFKPGTTRKTLELDGTETYDVIGQRAPGAELTLIVNRRNGERLEVPVTCRLDSDEEVTVYEAGGVLQRFAQDLLEGKVEGGRTLPLAREGRGEAYHPNPGATMTPQIKIPATYMRGGTSKGVFFRLQDLPASCQVPGEARD